MLPGEVRQRVLLEIAALKKGVAIRVSVKQTATKSIVATGRPRKPAKASKPQVLDDVEGAFRRLLKSGKLLEENIFLDRSRLTKRALGTAVRAGRLFFVEVGGLRVYPAFFVDERYERRQLEAVSKALEGLSGGGKWLFFSTPKAPIALPAKRGQSNGTLRTPLQAIEACDFKLVKSYATAFASDEATYMTLSQAISALEALRADVGDVRLCLERCGSPVEGFAARKRRWPEFDEEDEPDQLPFHIVVQVC